jgi:hypothetical protein
MNTIITASNKIIGASKDRRLWVRKVLLACGFLSALLYIATDIIGTIRFEGYSYTSQTVSELFAIDAPTRPLVVPLLTAYAILVYAFGLGVWVSAGQKRALRAAAVLIIAKEVLGLGVTLFAPMHLRGVATTLSDTMHGVLTGVGVFLCMFPAMGLGASVFGKKFRIYTIVTMLIFLLCGVLAFLYASQIGANQSTPWMGVLERTNIFGYLLWYSVLAVTLLRIPSGSLNLTDGEKNVLPMVNANRV